MTTVTTDERMVWALAQHARPEDVLVVGVATPMAMAAALLARETTAPGLTIVAAATVDPPEHDIAGPMVDAAQMDAMGVGTLSQAEILDQIQRGRVTLQFISPAEVDRWGRLNTSRVRTGDSSLRRLSGGLATGDIAVLMGRLVAYRADHSPRFLPEQVAFTTGAGHERGLEWRRQRGLPGRGVEAVVTDRAVMTWDRDAEQFGLAALLGGAEEADVRAATGFALTGAPTAAPDPPDDALEVLRRSIDPSGMRRLEVRESREEARRVLGELRR